MADVKDVKSRATAVDGIAVVKTGATTLSTMKTSQPLYVEQLVQLLTQFKQTKDATDAKRSGSDAVDAHRSGSDPKSTPSTMQSITTQSITYDTRAIEQGMRLTRALLASGPSKVSERWDDLVKPMTMVLLHAIKYRVVSGAATDPVYFGSVVSSALQLSREVFQGEEISVYLPTAKELQTPLLVALAHEDLVQAAKEAKHKLAGSDACEDNPRPVHVLSLCHALLWVTRVLLDQCPKGFVDDGAQHAYLPEKWRLTSPETIDVTSSIAQMAVVLGCVRDVLRHLNRWAVTYNKLLPIKVGAVQCTVGLAGSYYGLRAWAMSMAAECEFMCNGKKFAAIENLKIADREAEAAVAAGNVQMAWFRISLIREWLAYLHCCLMDYGAASDVASETVRIATGYWPGGNAHVARLHMVAAKMHFLRNDVKRGNAALVHGVDMAGAHQAQQALAEAIEHVKHIGDMVERNELRDDTRTTHNRLRK